MSMIPVGFMSDRIFGRSIQFKTKTSESPAVADPSQQAAQINAAQAQYDPQSAQRAYDIYTNPDYGAGALTKYNEQQRNEIFPNETAARNQLVQNIIQNLQSPTGISSDQQQAVDTSRGQAQNNLVEALRNRSNLGGTLYGGRSANEEFKAVGDLQNQFANEDINRDANARQQAISNAIPILQLLYPDVNITSPQYNSVVQDPNTYASSLLSQRSQDMQQQQSNNASQNALYSALFQGLGSAAGAYATGGLSAAIKPKSGVLG